MSTNILVVYFSATGTTRKLAQELANVIGADIYEIKPKIPYTKVDLNWHNKDSRSSIEMTDKLYRPSLKTSNAHVREFDTILLGFPIWWHVAPTIINTFLENYDFSNKRIILFGTSGGSGLGNTVEELEVSVDSSCTIEKGTIFKGRQTVVDLEEWVNELEF